MRGDGNREKREKGLRRRRGVEEKVMKR